MSLYGIGDYKSAESAFKEAIKLGEKSNKTIYLSHLALAKCYMEYKTRDYSRKALEELKIAEALNDNEEEKKDASRLIKKLEDKLK